MKKILLAVVSGLVLFTSCKKDPDPKEKVFKGAVQKIYDGKAWTWFEVDDNDKPVRLGIAIDEAAMNSLPIGGGGHVHENMFSLKVHPKVSDATPYKHVGLDWNPNGHEPEHIYDKPHFDFHYYMISEAERMAIPPYEQDSAAFKNIPGPAYFPPTYIYPGGGVPQMGAHHLDVTSPELSGQQPFTQTFIYGSFNGKVIFSEPMITLEFIKNNSGWERAIPQPQKYQKTAYYPTKISIRKIDGITNIILEGFVLRQAS